MRKINDINELKLFEKFIYLGPYLEKNDIDDTFYIHDVILSDINNANDKEEVLKLVDIFLETLTNNYKNNYNEFERIMNLDIELELIPFLQEKLLIYS